MTATSLDQASPGSRRGNEARQRFVSCLASHICGRSCTIMQHRAAGRLARVCSRRAGLRPNAIGGTASLAPSVAKRATCYPSGEYTCYPSVETFTYREAAADAGPSLEISTEHRHRPSGSFRQTVMYLPSAV